MHVSINTRMRRGCNEINTLFTVIILILLILNESLWTNKYTTQASLHSQILTRLLSYHVLWPESYLTLQPLTEAIFIITWERKQSEMVL